MKSRGFTLIELLVVIAIIGLLSSVILASLNTARAKARDAKVKSDFQQLSLALQLYYDDHNSMPAGAPSPYYIESALQPLVTGGYIPALPVSPSGYGYQYYNYGSGNSVGGLLVTVLEAAKPSSSGEPGSCRPWTAGGNWCDTGRVDNYYCICNPQ